MPIGRRRQDTGRLQAIMLRLQAMGHRRSMHHIQGTHLQPMGRRRLLMDRRLQDTRRTGLRQDMDIRRQGQATAR